MTQENVEKILSFWFGELNDEFDFPFEKAKLWFESTSEFNETIRQDFGALLAQAQAGALDAWAESPRGTLALVILLDQFTRNLHQDANAFALDAKALQIAQAALERKDDLKLKRVERAFLYLPFEHSEDLAMQIKSVALFEGLCQGVPADRELPFTNMLDYAQQHHKIIESFGRFPHRNEVLGRSSTPEEVEHLQKQSSEWEK